MATNKELEKRVKELEAIVGNEAPMYARLDVLEAQMNRVLAALHVAGWGIKKGEFIPESNKDEHSSISTGG